MQTGTDRRRRTGRSEDMHRKSKFLHRAWRPMSHAPTVQTVGKPEIRYQPVLILAALGACLLLQPYFVPIPNGSVSHIAQFSILLETGSPPNLDLGRSRCACGLTIPEARTGLWLWQVTFSFVWRPPKSRIRSTKVLSTPNRLPEQDAPLSADSPATTLPGHLCFLFSRFTV